MSSTPFTPSPRGLTAEQVLLIADEICTRYPTTIRDYTALYALAAATNARFHGISVHRDPEALSKQIDALAKDLAPLTTHNDLLGTILSRLLLVLNADFLPSANI